MAHQQLNIAFVTIVNNSIHGSSATNSAGMAFITWRKFDHERLQMDFPPDWARLRRYSTAKPRHRYVSLHTVIVQTEDPA